MVRRETKKYIPVVIKNILLQFSFGNERIPKRDSARGNAKKKECRLWRPNFGNLEKEGFKREPSFVFSCPCESEVPFGQLRPCFLVSAVVVGKACCFRYWRVAKRNDGWWWRCCLQGAVCLVVLFAKQPVRAEGLGSDGDVGTLFRRPSGLRGNGCGSQMKRRGLLLFVNRLRAGAR